MGEGTTEKQKNTLSEGDCANSIVKTGVKIPKMLLTDGRPIRFRFRVVQQHLRNIIFGISVIDVPKTCDFYQIVLFSL